MTRNLILLLAVPVVVALSGCPAQTGVSPDTKAVDSRRVVAVAYPLQFFTQAIAGETIDVEFPVDSEDPTQWRPSRDQIASMQSADLVVANGTGATYAQWLVTVSLADSKRIDAATKGMSLKDYISVEDVRVVHSHGPEGEHSHATMVSRTWLDPSVAKKQAAYISERLTKRYADQSDSFQLGFTKLKVRLNEIVQRADQLKAKTLLGEEGARQKVVTVTHELKFLTKATGFEDQHFGWSNESTLEEVRNDLDAAAKRGELLRKSDAIESGWPGPAHVLIPRSKSTLASRPFKELFREYRLEPVPIDLIDQAMEDMDYIDRMHWNLGQLEGIARE